MCALGGGVGTGVCVCVWGEWMCAGEGGVDGLDVCVYSRARKETGSVKRNQEHENTSANWDIRSLNN